MLLCLITVFRYHGPLCQLEPVWTFFSELPLPAEMFYHLNEWLVSCFAPCYINSRDNSVSQKISNFWSIQTSPSGINTPTMVTNVHSPITMWESFYCKECVRCTDIKNFSFNESFCCSKKVKVCILSLHLFPFFSPLHCHCFWSVENRVYNVRGKGYFVSKLVIKSFLNLSPWHVMYSNNCSRV